MLQLIETIRFPVTKKLFPDPLLQEFLLILVFCIETEVAEVHTEKMAIMNSECLTTRLMLKISRV